MIKEIDLERIKEEWLQIEDIVRKNKNLKSREIKKKGLEEDELESGEQGEVPQEPAKRERERPKDPSQTQRLSSPERFIEYPPPRVNSQKKKRQESGLDRLWKFRGTPPGVSAARATSGGWPADLRSRRTPLSWTWPN